MNIIIFSNDFFNIYNFRYSLLIKILEKYPTHFEEMEKFVNDEKCVSRLHHYFKHEYKISEGYISWHARITDAKRRAVRNLTSQLHKNLDEYRWLRKTPFKKDVI